ncbi:MAG: ribosome biogenesis/translation initiation ATPase RLI [Candidatus Micrarchaeota archaeon]
MRIAVLDRKKCKREECGYLCIKACPGVRMGEETIVKDEENYPVISENLCTGCGICVKKCPTGAIKVINLAGEGGELIHQYGVNAFRLFNLPIPREGSVLGLIGANGIGKTTALRILGGQITPNFGEYEKKHKLEEAVARVKSHEMINYFGSISKAKISYKPQNVAALPEMFSGTVEKLLKKADERKVFAQAISLFDLNNSLKKELKELSGGELQRVAMCAAWMKRAELYYFDEPSSYLDIGQRLRVARAIKELAEIGASVIVIEHDLALLDYLSDSVNVFYGTKGAYGVVSGLKSARNGINEFLDGYLKDENVRFRETGIKFELHGAGDDNKGVAAFAYEKMEKKYKGFKLACEEGAVNIEEVVGIIGPNAIGKSTFVKMIAGIEKPDKGSAEHKLKISYKPQYLKPEFEGTVAELINSTKINREIFELELKEKLEIHELMLKNVNELSGGELQRVSIALALAQDADLYLLDEPSAFLDIEQRLKFAHVLRKVVSARGKSAFVVDHDIVLIDSVSDRIMVFEGESGKEGKARAPVSKRSGMNSFLKGVEVTLRRDKDSKRPRVNKLDSRLDKEQKLAGEYYYYSKE